MRCPSCGEPLYAVAEAVSTCAGYVPFCDAEGRAHLHDGNLVSQLVACDELHVFQWSGNLACWCGWGVDSWGLVEVEDEPVLLQVARTRLLRVVGSHSG